MAKKTSLANIGGTPPLEAAPVALSSSKHPIRNQDISKGALRIIQHLEDAGYEAYLVGGGVRDLLLGGHPKDFDIATSATPEQIKSLFQRDARVVGRRFRIVHVRTGRDVTEVTTFRAHHIDAESEHQAARSANGMLLRDNVYGDIHSDALRRDFTMNALYYSPRTGVVTDFAQGMEDIRSRVVRIIGEPSLRYQEDPVRMLRAVRLAAKLDFTIESATAEPFTKLGGLLANVAPARLFDECLKLLMSGHALQTYKGLQRHGLFRHLFEPTQGCLDHMAQEQLSQIERMLEQAMINTDQRIQQGKRVTPAFILAVILWPAVVSHQQRLLQRGLKPAPALNQASQAVLSQQLQRIAIPRRFTLPMREIWDLQLRLPRRTGQQAFRLLAHPRFRAAYDFLLLREEAGEDHQGLGHWWTEFQAADSQGRESLVGQLRASKPRKKRTRRRPRKTNDDHRNDVH